MTDNRESESARRFEEHRDGLRGIAYRMLGSLQEAEDAVQQTWLRLARVDVDDIDNLGAWLRTAVSRVCLDLLRSRKARREEAYGLRLPDSESANPGARDPEREALLAESVGRALLVVLRKLSPAERVAFVLHDLFDVPFDEIAPVVERSTVAAKKLASRARHRVRGSPADRGPALAEQRRVVEAFLSASRAGDLEAVIAVLAPDVVRRADPAALTPGRPAVVRGARTVAEEIALFGGRSRDAEPVLLDGAVGLVVAPQGRLRLALTFSFDGDRISEYALVADPAGLRRLDVALLD